MMIFKISLRYSISLISVTLILSVLACSKAEKPLLSTEKMPITTSSQSALLDYQAGLEYANKVQNEQALLLFQAALEKDPGFALAWLNLAFVSPGINQLLLGLDSAKAHMKNVSEAEQLIIQAAECGIQQDNLSQKEILEQLVAKYPGDETAHLLLGNYYFGLQEYQLAIKSYSDAKTIDENYDIPYNQIGYCQRALGNYGEAEKAFKTYLNLNLENPNAYDSYAELLLEMGRYRESIELYKQALSVDSTFAASYIGIACNYDLLGEPERAHQQLQRLYKIAQNYIIKRRAIFAEVVSYVCEGNLTRAIDYIKMNHAIAAENGDHANMANDLVLMGNIFLELGRADEALSNFNQSIQVINSSDLQQAIKDNAQTTYLYNSSKVSAAQGDYQRAEQSAESFSKIVSGQSNPVQLRLVFQLNGIIAMYEKNYQIAIDQFEQADQLNPLNLYQMGLAYEALGMSSEANILIQRAEELNVLNSMNQALVLSKTRFKKEL